MKKDDITISGGLRQAEDSVRNLVLSTLAPLQSEIDEVAVTISYASDPPIAAGSYHCTMSLILSGRTALRSEACDCDYMLAVYKALAQMIDKTRPGGIDNERKSPNSSTQNGGSY